ncbi:MAG: tRNA dihydrouridine synthase DusB [Gemmataceae bacterium]|nr:tRNA dihydrouridine synthase DusB [Gemmataceae bacterium]
MTVRQLHFGSLRLESRYLLAPLAGYTNMAFRLAVRELGGLGLATTELVNARALLSNSKKTKEYIDTCPGDQPLAVQIFGADPQEMAAAAQWLEEYGASAIDINMGCPVHKVVRQGAGSALLCNAGAAAKLVRAVVEAVRLPVTVKMRLGWDDANHTAPQCAREFEQAGVAAVIVHGRTREQGFSGKVNHAGIRAVVEAVHRIPVIGNGDVRTVAEAQQMFEATGCAGISIGRGALLNPWIFRQLCRWEATGDPGPGLDYDARLTFMARHFHLLLQQRGERHACLTFRKSASWHCRVLKPGKEIQQRLVMIASAADFDAIVDQLRAQGPPPRWHHQPLPELAVPQGPISHW